MVVPKPLCKKPLIKLNAEGIVLDAMRVRAFPFNLEVWEFIEDHDLLVYSRAK